MVRTVMAMVLDLETVPPSGMLRRREPRSATPHHFVIDARGRLR